MQVFCVTATRSFSAVAASLAVCLCASALVHGQTRAQVAAQLMAVQEKIDQADASVLDDHQPYQNALQTWKQAEADLIAYEAAFENKLMQDPAYAAAKAALEKAREDHFAAKKHQSETYEKVNKATTAQASIKSTMVPLARQVAGMEKRLATKQAQLDHAINDTDVNEHNVSGDTANRIAKLREQMAEIQGRIDELMPTIQEGQAKLEEIDGQLPTMRSDAEKANKRLAKAIKTLVAAELAFSHEDAKADKLRDNDQQLIEHKQSALAAKAAVEALRTQALRDLAAKPSYRKLIKTRDRLAAELELWS